MEEGNFYDDVYDKYDHNDELVDATLKGQEELQKLLDDGLHVNSKDRYGNTALLVAAAQGDETTVKFLLGLNADINAKNYFGKSAFHFATANGHENVVKILLNSDVVIHASTFGNECHGTVLHLAVKKDKPIILKLFLEHGCNVNATDEFDFTPLYYAVENSSNHQDEMMRMLGEYKSNEVLDSDTPPLKKQKIDTRSHDSATDANLLENDSYILFFFHVETSGYLMEGRLLQIALKSKDCSFETSIANLSKK